MTENKAVETSKPITTDPEEARLMEQYRSKKSELSFKDGKITSKKEGRHKGYAAVYLADQLKVSNIDTALDFLTNAFATRKEKNTEQVFEEIRDLDPQSALETMLASQMVAVNASIGRLMTNAMIDGQNSQSRERNLNLATKLQRTFLQQIEAYQKLKGKGQQTVTVKHVTVNEGGQAIVGNIEQTGGRV